jgi:hypothetical protein
MDTTPTPGNYNHFFEAEYNSEEFFIQQRIGEEADPFSSSFGNKNSQSQQTFQYGNLGYQTSLHQQERSSDTTVSSKSPTSQFEQSTYQSLQPGFNYQLEEMNLSKFLITPSNNLQQPDSDSNTFNPDNYPTFRAEIERSRKQKRESARRNAIDQIQYRPLFEIGVAISML